MKSLLSIIGLIYCLIGFSQTTANIQVNVLDARTKAPLDSFLLKAVYQSGDNFELEGHQSVTFKVDTDSIFVFGVRSEEKKINGKQKYFASRPVMINQLKSDTLIDLFLEPTTTCLGLNPIIGFGKNSDSLMPPTHLALNALVDIANANPDLIIKMAGRQLIDESKGIYLKRTAVVYDKLIELGVSPERLIFSAIQAPVFYTYDGVDSAVYNEDYLSNVPKEELENSIFCANSIRFDVLNQEEFEGQMLKIEVDSLISIPNHVRVIGLSKSLDRFEVNGRDQFKFELEKDKEYVFLFKSDDRNTIDKLKYYIPSSILINCSDSLEPIVFKKIQFYGYCYSGVGQPLTHFEFNQVDITSESKMALSPFLDEWNDTMNIVIQGRQNEGERKGTYLKRAKNVKQYLMSKGIPKNQIQVAKDPAGPFVYNNAYRIVTFTNEYIESITEDVRIEFAQMCNRSVKISIREK